jgi:hypothetical protein
MFGSKLSVLAKRFPAIHELVKDQKNGILFDTAKDLEQSILKISEKFPSNEILKDLRNNVAENFKCWEENWEGLTLIQFIYLYF